MLGTTLQRGPRSRAKCLPGEGNLQFLLLLLRGRESAAFSKLEELIRDRTPGTSIVDTVQ